MQHLRLGRQERTLLQLFHGFEVRIGDRHLFNLDWKKIKVKYKGNYFTWTEESFIDFKISFKSFKVEQL